VVGARQAALNVLRNVVHAAGTTYPLPTTRCKRVYHEPNRGSPDLAMTSAPRMNAELDSGKLYL